VTLKAARTSRDDARKIQQQDIAPVQRRQLEKLECKVDSDASFEVVAREYHKTKSSALSPRYSERWISIMEKDAFPWLGSLPLSIITAPMLLQVLRRIEARGAHDHGRADGRRT
jgi:hypothetical protein